MRPILPRAGEEQPDGGGGGRDRVGEDDTDPAVPRGGGLRFHRRRLVSRCCSLRALQRRKRGNSEFLLSWVLGLGLGLHPPVLYVPRTVEFISPRRRSWRVGGRTPQWDKTRGGGGGDGFDSAGCVVVYLSELT